MSVGVRCFRRVLVQILGIDPIKITSSSKPWGCHLYQGTQAVSLKFQVPRPSRRPHELVWLPTLLVIDELIDQRELNKCQLRTSSCSIVRFYSAGGRRVPLRKQQGNSPQTQDTRQQRSIARSARISGPAVPIGSRGRAPLTAV